MTVKRLTAVWCGSYCSYFVFRVSFNEIHVGSSIFKLVVSKRKFSLIQNVKWNFFCSINFRSHIKFFFEWKFFWTKFFFESSVYVWGSRNISTSRNKRFSHFPPDIKNHNPKKGFRNIDVLNGRNYRGTKNRSITF